MYGEEVGEAYDKTHAGIPIGGILKTTIYVYMLEDAKGHLGRSTNYLNYLIIFKICGG